MIFFSVLENLGLKDDINDRRTITHTHKIMYTRLIYSFYFLLKTNSFVWQIIRFSVWDVFATLAMIYECYVYRVLIEQPRSIRGLRAGKRISDYWDWPNRYIHTHVHTHTHTQSSLLPNDNKPSLHKFRHLKKKRNIKK